MRVTILGASGSIGRELVRQGLLRGHTVTAISRSPADAGLGEHRALRLVAADVRDAPSVQAALHGSEVIVSALGLTKGEQPGLLAAGAAAMVDARPERMLAVGALGTGASRKASGWLTPILLRFALGKEIADKVAADEQIVAAGGTVFHLGLLSDGPISDARGVVGLVDVPRRILPPRTTRDTVAAALLDEVEARAHPGAVVVPFEQQPAGTGDPRPSRADGR